VGVKEIKQILILFSMSAFVSADIFLLFKLEVKARNNKALMHQN
jgi:hypothetical protein